MIRSIARTAIAAALTGASVLSIAAPAQAAARPLQRTSVSAYLNSATATAALNSVLSASKTISNVTPMWFSSDCASLSAGPKAGDPTTVAALAKAGISITPTITSGLGIDEAISCYSSTVRRAQYAQRIVDVTVQGNYPGIDLDFENMAVTTDVAKAQQLAPLFSAFVVDVCAELHRVDKTCSITVMPRTDDTFSPWRSRLIPAVYDYTQIGRYADTVRVMAYDNHASTTAAGAIGDLSWIKAVSDYTAAKIAPSKVQLGLNLYGRDWSAGSAKTIFGEDALKLAAAKGAVINRLEGESTFAYTEAGVEHTVYFPTGATQSERIALAQSKGFSGVIFWTPGQETNDTWAAVASASASYPTISRKTRVLRPIAR